MIAQDFRRLALELPEAVEGAHMGHPDFRVAGRVFATLGYPARGWATVMLTPDQQEWLVRAHPTMFTPVKGAWGRSGSTNVRLQAARKAPVREALYTAWANRAPNRLRKPTITEESR